MYYEINKQTKFEKLAISRFDEALEDFSQCEDDWQEVEWKEIEIRFQSLHEACKSTRNEAGVKYTKLENIKAILSSGHLVNDPYHYFRIKTTDMKCPLCGASFDESHASLSRRDNKTYICSDCGTKEALDDFVVNEK